MAAILFGIFSVSLAALIAGVVYLEFIRARSRRLTLGACVIALALGIFLLARSANLETKGNVDEGVAVFLCYIAMLGGMIADYCYKQAEQGRKRFKFEPMQFLMPIFASPIVFIPLLTITADMSIGGAFAKAKLMVYLVAFQNGFFWRSFFEQRKLQAVESTRQMATELAPPATERRARAATAQ